MCYALMLLPVGYFLPIISKRAGKIKNTTEVSLGLMWFALLRITSKVTLLLW